MIVCYVFTLNLLATSFMCDSKINISISINHKLYFLPPSI